MIKKRLVRLLAHARKYIVYQVIWQWIALLAQVTAVFAIGTLLEGAFTGNSSLEQLMQTAVILAGAIAIRWNCDRQNAKASYAASTDVKWILRNQIYEKLLRLGSGYREQVSTSEVVQMSAEGVEQLEIYFGKYLAQLFYSLLAPVTLFAILAFINVKASVVLLICVPLIPISIVAVQKFAKKLLNKYWGIYTELGDSFLENLQGLTTLKIYQADEGKAVEMDEEAARFRKITMKVLTMQLNSTSVMDIIAYGGAAVGMVVAVSEYAQGRIGLAGVITLILLASEFFIPLRLLGSFFHIAMNGMAASDKIFALLDLPEPAEKTESVDVDSIDIQMEGVRFAYEKEREILADISLELPAGSFTSIVGVSGSGKSTIAGILMGKNVNYQGKILIAGKELSEIREQSLMEHITLIRHNSYLFQGTVEDNLRMGNSKATAAEIQKVLQKVNLWEFLKTQKGLQTAVQEKGTNFSGGQCQRLALARALLHDTPVYIFDEATSNIDVESEEMILAVIHELARTKTILLISHRLANVVGSDCIYMLKEGRMLESGTHDELMKRRGDYSRLYAYQKELEQYGRMEVEA